MQTTGILGHSDQLYNQSRRDYGNGQHWLRELQSHTTFEGIILGKPSAYVAYGNVSPLWPEPFIFPKQQRLR